MTDNQHPPHTIYKSMLCDFDSQDAEYNANLAKYMSTKDVPGVHSKL